MLGEQQEVGNDWNATNHVCRAHMTNNQGKTLEELQERSFV